jgi:hypothetical protein
MRPQLFIPGVLLALSQAISEASAAGACSGASITPTNHGFSAWKWAFGVFSGVNTDLVSSVHNLTQRRENLDSQDLIEL